MGAQQEKEDGVNVDGRLSRRFESRGRSREGEKRNGKDDLNYTMVGFRQTPIYDKIGANSRRQLPRVTGIPVCLLVSYRLDPQCQYFTACLLLASKLRFINFLKFPKSITSLIIVGYWLARFPMVDRLLVPRQNSNPVKIRGNICIVLAAATDYRHAFCKGACGRSLVECASSGHGDKGPRDNGRGGPYQYRKRM